jgi:hypothetical protein
MLFSPGVQIDRQATSVLLLMGRGRMFLRATPTKKLIGAPKNEPEEGAGL